MGCECCVVYDFVNVVNGEVIFIQVLIKDKCFENLYVLVVSQICDKDVLIKEGVEKVMVELCKDFEYIICDFLVGIEKGVYLVMYFVDEVIVVINFEVFLVCDFDCMFGLLVSKLQCVEKGEELIKEYLLLICYNLECVIKGEMFGVDDVEEIFVICLFGVILEFQVVFKVLNQGVLVIFDEQSDVGQVYSDVVDCLFGKEILY